VNKENHLQPILSMVQSTLNKVDEGNHSSVLLELLAEELGVDPAAIKDLELTLCDTQGGAIWGAKNEFLSSPRLDNQIHCYTGLTALLAHSRDLSQDTGVSMLACFDHEEIGSESAQGAGSPVMEEGISRVLGCFDTSDEIMKITKRNSFLISADVGHAIHPNYSDKHEKQHQPTLNKGTLIKSNCNQRYATNAETGFILRELARRAGVPFQEFVVRNDCPCGSTIGPIVSARTGIRTVDLGVPSLSMHSIRETIGVADIETNTKLLTYFYTSFGELDKSCSFN
jgi:aspartyl aminopeptidase